MSYQRIKTILFILFLTIGLYACGGDVGGNEDKTSPVVALTSLNDGEEVVGTYNITWTTDDPNPSSVDIYLSSDSGGVFDTVIELNVPDTGEYDWDSNTVTDCRDCRVRVVSHDVVGNEGEPAESAVDFIVNNLPQLFGVALYYDPNNNGLDSGDSIVVPFDKDIELFAPFSFNFRLPVINDSFGINATVSSGPAMNELTIGVLNNADDLHINVKNSFSPDKTYFTAASGIDIAPNIQTGSITAIDTGLTAASSGGIDFFPTFSDSGTALGEDVVVDGRTDSTKSVKLADIDNDKDLDIVEGTSNSNRVYINQGGLQSGVEGDYLDSGLVFGNGSTESVDVGDVDNDGDLDIVTGNYGQANRVWLNQGGVQAGVLGDYASSGQALGNDVTFSIALGDVDNDGDLDIVTGNWGSVGGGNTGNRVWLNQGGVQAGVLGDYMDSGQVLGINYTYAVVLGDVDNDDDLDVIIGNDGEANLVWINQGGVQGGSTGVYSDSGQMLSALEDWQEWSTISLVLGDVDDDGDVDLIEGLRSGANKLWLNQGGVQDGNIGVYDYSGRTLGVTSAQSVSLGDLDGDKDLDLVIGNDGLPNSVWVNDGGVFSDSGQLVGDANSTFSVALGDVDGDGDLDQVEGVLTGSAVPNGWADRILLNSTTTFSSKNLVDSSQDLGESGFSVIGDVDGDGDLDKLKVMRLGSELWLNNGNGRYTNSMQALPGARNVVMGDVDNDGDQDLVLAKDYRGNANSVLLNNGEGFFSSGQILGSYSVDTIAMGDIDADGDLDLVQGINGSFPLSDPNFIWVNQGGMQSGTLGVFVESGQTMNIPGKGNKFPTSFIALEDIDNDTDLDLIEGYSYIKNSVTNVIWRNDGNGVFSYDQQVGLDAADTIVVGDIDNDDDLDLVMSSGEVWINDTNHTDGTNGVAGSFIDSTISLGVKTHVDLGDMDGDGYLDLVFTENSNDVCKVWLNNSFGSFVDVGLSTSLPAPSRFVMGDVDNDNDLDIFFEAQSMGDRLFFNDY